MKTIYPLLENHKMGPDVENYPDDRRPVANEKWRRKTDHSKVLTVKWINTCDYVHFDAPWMKRYSGCCLDVFLKRYERI